MVGSRPLKQFKSFESAVDEQRFDDAVRATTFLRNVLAPVPAFRESLTAVRTPTELIAEPFDRFLALMPPPAQPSPADPSITYAAEAAGSDAATALLASFRRSKLRRFSLLPTRRIFRRLDGSGATWPFPSGSGGSLDPPSASALVALDWNHDFRTDIVMAGRGGVRAAVAG